MGALFGKDDFPLVIAQVQQIARIGEIKELLSWPFIRFALPSGQEIVAVKMNLGVVVAEDGAFQLKTVDASTILQSL